MTDEESLRNRLADSRRKILELEDQVEALKELSIDMFMCIRDSNASAWYEQRLKKAGVLHEFRRR